MLWDKVHHVGGAGTTVGQFFSIRGGVSLQLLPLLPEFQLLWTTCTERLLDKVKEMLPNVHYHNLENFRYSKVTRSFEN